jgi:hypothetical protein
MLSSSDSTTWTIILASGQCVDGAGDQLAFQNYHIGRVAFQRGAQVLQRLGLRHHPDVVFQSEDLLHADAVDCLRVGQDDADARCRAGLLMVVEGGLHMANGGGLHMANGGGLHMAIRLELFRIVS